MRWPSVHQVFDVRWGPRRALETERDWPDKPRDAAEVQEGATMSLYRWEPGKDHERLDGNVQEVQARGLLIDYIRRGSGMDSERRHDTWAGSSGDRCTRALEKQDDIGLVLEKQRDTWVAVRVTRDDMSVLVKKLGTFERALERRRGTFGRELERRRGTFAMALAKKHGTSEMEQAKKRDTFATEQARSRDTCARAQARQVLWRVRDSRRGYGFCGRSRVGEVVRGS